MYNKVDHVVIAVSDLDAAAALYGKTLGLKPSEVMVSRELGLKRINFDVGNAYIEIAQPIDETGPVARFVKEKGEGLYLIAVKVDSIKETVGKLRRQGARIIGDENAGGQVFIHPKSTHGVLMQLVE